MNSKAAATLFGIACVVLALAFFWRHASAESRKRDDATTIVQLSNEVTHLSEEVQVQKAVGLKIQGELEEKTKEVSTLSNQLSSTRTELTKTKGDASAASAAAAADKAKMEATLAQYESEKDMQTKRMAELDTKIKSLESEITKTQQLLETSNSDKEFLQKELARLQKEKAELEKQFNDLALLREQVKKLQEELSIAKRIEWVKQGLYNTLPKGAEMLKNNFKTVTQTPTNAGYSLSVEITRIGGVSNVTSRLTNSPTSIPTNRPAGR